MKYIKQWSIILLISFFGEVLHELLPLPIPASVYGLVLMLTALCAGIVKLEQVKETAKFLVEVMPLMFIPATVGLMTAWDSLQSMLVPVVVILVVTTVGVMAVTGRVTQFVIRRKDKEAGK